MSILIIGAALKWSPTYQSESAIYYRKEGCYPWCRSLLQTPRDYTASWSALISKEVLDSVITYIPYYFLSCRNSYLPKQDNTLLKVKKYKYHIDMAYTRALLLSSILSYCTSAITVIPLTLNLPKPYESAVAPVTSDSDLLSELYIGTTLGKNAFYSPYVRESWSNITLDGIYASQDSFFRGTIDAGAKHQHLVIQPQDVWLIILKQLSFYLRKHKDTKQVVEIWDNLDGKTTQPMWSSAMWGMDSWMTTQFNLRSKAGWLLDWVQPDFTTVSQQIDLISGNSSEVLLAKALMMASSFPSTETLSLFPCKNGFPSITLNGTEEDWKKIIGKLDSLEKFGEEPKIYSRLLRPVLSRFVQTFEKPNDPIIRLFWNDMVTITARQHLCSTTELITGWINAFHMWDPAGNLAITTAIATSSESLNLDGVTYPWRHRKDTPVANTAIPMCVVGGTPRWASFPVSGGMLAKSVKKGKPQGYEAAMKLAGFTLPSSVSESDHSILQPLPVWISFIDSSVSTTSVSLSNQRKLTNVVVELPLL
jgi:hypothetical protein